MVLLASVALQEEEAKLLITRKIQQADYCILLRAVVQSAQKVSLI